MKYTKNEHFSGLGRQERQRLAQLKLPEEQIYIPNFFALEQQLPHESPSNLHGTVKDPSF